MEKKDTKTTGKGKKRKGKATKEKERQDKTTGVLVRDTQATVKLSCCSGKIRERQNRM
jgi:hypothetical protein